MPRFPGSHRGTSAAAVDGSCSQASMCISLAPHMGKGGQDVFTESQPGSTREEEELFPLILPPPFGFLFWHCPRPKKRWEFGKVKVYHCISLALHLISLLRKPGWTFFPPSLLNTQRLKIPSLLLMWKRLGNMFLCRRWVIWQKDKVRWGQGMGAKVLPNSWGSSVTAGQALLSAEEEEEALGPDTA